MNDPITHDIAKVARIEVVPRILRLVCQVTGMGYAVVARVTEDRWVACGVEDRIDFGLGVGGELEIQTTLCNEVRQGREPIFFSDVDKSDAYRDHHTPRLYGLKSYIAWPIYLRGEFFGTLCAIDPNPADLDRPEVREQFALFSELIAFHLETQDQLESSAAALLDAQATSQLREQFIAVLGHDLRNPLASIEAGARLLRKTPLNDRGEQVVGLIEHSVERMAGLIDDVLDFARGRLGGGIDVALSPDPDLAEALQQVVEELRAPHPDRLIVSDIVIGAPVACDSRRLGQLFSNLLANALSHGDETQPIHVRARGGGGTFELSVANGGRPIPVDIQQQLFQPFSRASASPGQEGLGLGLYIASAIAAAHGGTLGVASDAAETRFTFRMGG